MSASNYSEKAILNGLLRGVALAVPAQTYVALHTANPTEDGSQGEVTIASWPSYLRVAAEKGDVIGTGWTAPAAGDVSASANAKQLVFPANNGAGPVTVSYLSVWDALTGGNMIAYGALSTSQVVSQLDTILFEAGQIVFTAT